MTDPAADTTKSTSTNLLRALRRRKWLIAVCTALAAAAALSISLSQSKEYSASASLLFRDPGFSQELVGAPVLAVGDPTREAATNLQLVSLPTVAARAARRLGHGFTRSVVASYVNVSADGQSNVVSVTATTPTPTLSAKVANTFAQEYIILRRD